MPLTEQEKRGFSDILSLLLPEDVISLARTTVKDQVKILQQEEAVNAILSYSLDAQELFRRKKLKKEHLFQYLYSRGVGDVSPSAEKNVLVKRILKYWGSEETFELMEDDDAPQALFPNNLSQEDATSQQDIETLNCWADKSLVPNALDREFAVEFCRWFYVMLNNARNSTNNARNSTNNSSGLTANDSAFNISHFFEDCNMRFLVKMPNNVSVYSFSGATEVTTRLLKLVCDEGVLLNPNLSERGIQTLCDAYGRKVIIVAGTVHHGDSIGLFEQHFGLVRDPAAEFSWKIKFTRIAFLFSGNSQIQQEPILEYTKTMLTR